MTSQTVHEEVREVLPWLVNDSLAERERQRVLAHLRECPACRRERDELQAWQQVVVESDGTEGGNYRFAFKKLMSRIEAAEANKASTRGFDQEPGFGAWLAYVGAAASLFVGVLFVAALTETRHEPDFTTLSSGEPRMEGVPHRVALTFEQPIQADTLRAALIETRSNIVSGPDAAGTYILEVIVPKDMTDRDFINSMRRIEGVQYAAFDGHTDPHR